MGNSSTSSSSSTASSSSKSTASNPTVTSLSLPSSSSASPSSSSMLTSNVLVATIVAGSPEHGAGYRNGHGRDAQFNNPCGLSFDHSGNLYVCDRGNHRIRRISPSGEVTTFVGDGLPRFNDGTGTSASIEQPLHMVVTRQGQFVAVERQSVVLITADGSMTNMMTPVNRSTMKNLHSQSLTIDEHDRVYFSSSNNIYEMNVASPDQVSTYSTTNMYGSTHALAIRHRDSPLVVSLASGLRQFTRIDSKPLVRDITGGWSGTPPTDGIGMDASVAYVTDMAMDRDGGTWLVDCYTTTIRYMSPWLASLRPRLLDVTALASLPPGLLPIIIDYLDMSGYDNALRTYTIINSPANASTQHVLPLLDSWGVVIDTHGYIYVSSRNTHCIYRLTTIDGAAPSSPPAVPLTTIDVAHLNTANAKADNDNDNDND